MSLQVSIHDPRAWEGDKVPGDWIRYYEATEDEDAVPFRVITMRLPGGGVVSYHLTSAQTAREVADLFARAAAELQQQDAEARALRHALRR